MTARNRGSPPDRSNLQENLFSLYLRLNGYFVTGFIVHASEGNKTELDALAVRFPHHREPEREIGPSSVLGTSDRLLDFLVCEIKGGARNIHFNRAFREEPEAIAGVLNRFGAFSLEEISDIIPQIQHILRPEYLRKARNYPTIEIPRINARLRFVLVAPDQNRDTKNHRPYIYGDDMITYIWECFRPEARRQHCAASYDWDLWGDQYTKLVRYFKDGNRVEPGNIQSVYDHCCE